MRLQPLRYRGAFGPKFKLSRRKAFLHEPKALAVICETLNRGSPAVSKNEKAAGKWIVLQYPFTDSGQSIDAVPEINRFNRNEDPHLRSDLDHGLCLQNVLLRAFRSGDLMPLRWILIFAPLRVSSSITHSGACPETTGLSSTKDGVGSCLTLVDIESFPEIVVI